MKLENISKSFGNLKVLENFSLTLPKDGITCLLGPSGCGKTTLLNIVAGLEKAYSGSVLYEEGAKQRVSCIFQEPRLLPWRTSLENVRLPLENLGLEDADRIAREALVSVGLEQSMDMLPAKLSGGMRQRVSIARAFCYPSSVILMDEPFQSLDVGMKDKLVKEFISIWERFPKTVLWVTHDISEACLASDKVVVVKARPMEIVLNENVCLERSLRNELSMSELRARVHEALVQNL